MHTCPDVRPLDVLDPELMGTVERFASGAGRYEHLDALWKDDAEINTYKEWSALAARASISEEVRRLISLRDAMAQAIGSELSDDGLESTARTVMEDLANRKILRFSSEVGFTLVQSLLHSIPIRVAVCTTRQIAP